MSLLCAAGHMESSQCVWRRWQKTATATATERVAAVFWFLLSAMRSPTNTRSLGRVSFSFSISSCSCYSSFKLCTHHLVCPTAPHTTHTDVGLQFASSFFRSSLSLSLPPLCSLHSATLHSPLSLSLSLSASLAFFSFIYSPLIFGIPIPIVRPLCMWPSIRVRVRSALLFVLTPRVVVVVAGVRD